MMDCRSSAEINAFFLPNLSDRNPKTIAPNITPKLNTIWEVSGSTFLSQTRSHCQWRTEIYASQCLGFISLLLPTFATLLIYHLYSTGWATCVIWAAVKKCGLIDFILNILFLLYCFRGDISYFQRQLQYAEWKWPSIHLYNIYNISIYTIDKS